MEHCEICEKFYPKREMATCCEHCLTSLRSELAAEKAKIEALRGWLKQQSKVAFERVGVETMLEIFDAMDDEDKYNV